MVVHKTCTRETIVDWNLVRMPTNLQDKVSVYKIRTRAGVTTSSANHAVETRPYERVCK